MLIPNLVVQAITLWFAGIIKTFWESHNYGKGKIEKQMEKFT